MTSRKHRPLTPRETARRDQVMAHARDRDTEPGVLVVVVEDVAPGEQCSWCDCPARPGLWEHDPTCVGCRRQARYGVQIGYGSTPLPVCRPHFGDVPRTIRALLGDLPVEFGPTWEDES